MSDETIINHIAVELWLRVADVRASWLIYKRSYAKPDIEQFKTWLECCMQPPERFEGVA